MPVSGSGVMLRLTVSAPGKEPEKGTAIVDGDRLTLAQDSDIQLMRRIDEEQKTGACRHQKVIPLNAH